MERLHKMYLVLTLTCAKHLWDNTSSCVEGLPFPPYNLQKYKRIKGLKKQLYSLATLGNLTNSACISIAAACFIQLCVCVCVCIHLGLGGERE